MPMCSIPPSWKADKYVIAELTLCYPIPPTGTVYCSVNLAAHITWHGVTRSSAMLPICCTAKLVLQDIQTKPLAGRTQPPSYYICTASSPAPASRLGHTHGNGKIPSYFQDTCLASRNLCSHPTRPPLLGAMLLLDSNYAFISTYRHLHPLSLPGQTCQVQVGLGKGNHVQEQQFIQKQCRCCFSHIPTNWLESYGVSRHMLSYMPMITRTLFHLAVLCDSLRCGAYGAFCYGIS